MSVHNNVGIENGYFGNYVKLADDTFTFNQRGRAVYVNRCSKKLETGHQQLELQYSSNTDDETILIIDRGELVRGSAPKFLRHGIDAYEDNISCLLKTIQQQENQVPITYEHDGLGWMDYQGKRIYRAHKVIVPKDMDLQSTYAGKFDVTPRGDFKKYLGMIKKEVIGKVPLEFALSMGASSIITGYFKDELGGESFLYHIGAESSSGKTTAGQLAISVSSKPSFSANSLMSNWNNTANYQMGMLRDNRGMMVLFDESSTLGKKDITNTIYDLTGGKGRGRMSKDLSIADTDTWGTSFMSTGEGSLKGYMNKNTGLRVRMFESLNEKWTKDARNADAIKQCVTDNYGFIGIVIAKYLVNEDYEVAKKAYYENVQFYLDGLATKDEFSERIAKKLGTILYATELLNKILKLGLDKQKIRDFLIRQEEDDEEEKDLGLKAYNYIIETVASNINKFYTQMKEPVSGNMIDTVPRGEVWGKVDTRKKNGKVIEEILILPTRLEEILKDGNFSNKSTILRQMRDKGLMDCESGKFKTRRKLPQSKNKIFVYCILVECESSGSEKRKCIELYKQQTIAETVEDIFNED